MFSCLNICLVGNFLIFLKQWGFVLYPIIKNMNLWAPLALNANKTNKTIILSLGILSIMARITFQTHYLVRWNPEEWPCLISIIKVLRFVNLRNFEQLLPSPVLHCWRIYTSTLSQYSFINNMSLLQIINPASTVTECSMQLTLRFLNWCSLGSSFDQTTFHIVHTCSGVFLLSRRSCVVPKITY